MDADDLLAGPRGPVVRAVLARIFVDDIDVALPMYRQLSGEAEPRHFEFGAVQLCWIGPFLLLRVPPDERSRYARTATLLVADIAAVARIVEQSGGTVLEGPAPAPNGARMIARHGDGAVFEYIETG